MSRPFLVLILAAGLFGPVGRATAGWVTIKNETDHPVVVQDSCVVKGQVRRGKPIRLMPGEVVREYQSCPGGKTVHVVESGGRKRSLTSGELTWDKGDQSYAVRKDGDAVKLQSSATPTTAAAVTKADPTRRK